jgi:signal transduction histidine kinase
LAHARDIALEASRLKSQLLANVSHDLRTPLSAILGYVDMLQEGIYGPLLDQQHTIISRIMNSTGQLADLVGELLDQAQLEAGTLKLTLTSFAPTALLDHVRSTMSVLAETKGLEFTAEIAADLPP